MFNLAEIAKEELGICGLVDAYKPSHPFQYPAGTSKVVAYLESRKNKFAGEGEDGKVVWFGIWAFVQQYLVDPIDADQVEAAAEFWERVGVPFPKDDFMYIVEKYDGYLPIEIRTLPEGTVADTHTALYVIESKDERLFWLPAFIETIIQQAVWYPSTVATLSWYVKKEQMHFQDISSDEDRQALVFKLHDFGFRGVSSLESAILGAMSHAVNFWGSDTSVCNMAIEYLYGKGDIATFSIPAMEHMTATAWGRDNEAEAIRNFITKFCVNGGEGGMGSVIADTYNLFNFCEKILGEELHELISVDVANAGGTVVVRPDSGDPTRIPIRVMEMLGEKFGYTTNSKGYMVLPPYLRVIQGDGMNLESIRELYHNMAKAGWALDNIAVGMGGGLLQKVDRDTLGFAQKGSEITVNGSTYGISKDPITDPGKKSQEGNFSVVRRNGKLVNVPKDEVGDDIDYLQVVYDCGVKGEYSSDFKAVRLRANAGLVRVYAGEKVKLDTVAQESLELI